VPIHRGLLLLAVLGVGFIAILVDFLAVSLRRASLAGLPLLTLYAVPVAIDRDGVRVSTFILGAAGYLWLLATDHIGRVQRWGRPFRDRNRDELFTSTPLGNTGRWVGFFGIVIALVVPLFAPGLTAAGWFATGLGNGLGSGSGRSVQTINPVTELKGRLVQKDEVELLRLKTNDPSPFYLRLTTLDSFGSAGWTQRKLTAIDRDQVSRGINDNEDLDASVPVRKQRTAVEIRGFSASPYLPIYSNPTKVDIKGDWRWDDQADTVFSSRSTTGKQRYNFESTRIEYDRARLAAAEDLDPSNGVLNDYTGTNNGSETVAEDLAQRLVAGKKSQYDKVMAIHDHFSPENDFQYSLETKSGTTGSDLADFLTNKRGYCEQYASAMAFLVRAAGIPARVAVGFTRGRDKGDYVSVTNRDAHAWVEVYFSGLGWVPFDPTPSSGTDGRTGTLDWTRSDTANDPGSNPAPAPSATATPSVRPSEREDPTNDPLDALTLPSDRDPPKKLDVPWWMSIVALTLDGKTIPDVPTPVWWLIGTLVVLAVGSVPALLRARVRRRRMAEIRSGDPILAANAAWDELLDTLADLGSPVPESETPRVTARRLAAEGLDEADQHAITLLASDEERARYAPRRAAAARAEASRRGEATQRILAVHVVGRSIADRLSLRARLVARLLPPSLINRVSTRFTEWSEETSIRVRATQATLRQRLVPTR
jgi:transglutaminase-like putative cysteine protease